MTARVAVICTSYTDQSHGQAITDRFLIGYPHEGRWHRPDLRVVALYVEQKPEGDQSAQRAAEFGFHIYPTIAEALRCGGEKLAVDAVVLAGDFCKPCVEVFETDRRAVPVYLDMQLSGFEDAKRMVESARRLNFPLLAGSALPLTWRLPDIELPPGCEIENALVVSTGESDSPEYRALEAMLAMIERRKNGESGIQAVEMIEGADVWRAGDKGRWSKQLLTAALSRSDTPQGLTLHDGRTQDLVGSGELPKLVAKPMAYLIEHRDGLRTTLLMLNGAVKDFTFAARLEGGRIESTQFLLTPAPNASYTACVAAKIEEMFVTGKAPYPAERALIANGLVESCSNAKSHGVQVVVTPHLNIAYQAPVNSQHCRS
jgi:hypothetical protein